MIYILNIYKKDSRTKSGRRICGSYEFDRKDLVSMQREVKELQHLYKPSDGYTFEVVEPQK
jgi:hypothetical protein